jgi:hypothetical protein
MAGKLITLPLRVWFQSAWLLTRTAGAVAGRVYSLAGQTLGARSPNGTGSAHVDARPEQPREPRDEPIPMRPPRAQFAEEPPPRAPVHVSEEREPVHVSEERELVRESAEPGAEDGAGATVTVIEPWSGYTRMNARDVIARARQADRAELAAVRLYESRHRSRQTVLAAVDRQLKVGNGSDPA